MTRPSTDHVVIVARDGELLQCRHCGAGHQPTLPMPSARFETVLRGFSLMHRLCPKPEAPSPQMALPGTEQKPTRVISRTIADPVCLVDDMETEDECCARTVREEMAAEIAAGRHPLACFGIDASTDEPAPEIDPPGPEPWAHKYPMARDHAALRGHLLVALSNSGLNTPTVEQLQQWAHPATGIFDAAAHWARIQVAALNETEDRKHDPSWIGPRERPPMPEKLRELIEGEAPKKKRRRK